MQIAVFIGYAGFLGEDCFGVTGGHAEKSDDPHPEYCSGAAGEDRSGSTDDVAGADLGGNGGGKGLK